MIKTRKIQLRQIKEKYCNDIADLIKINRKSHYQKCFEENKRNSKAILQGIHNIIYSKKSNRINTPSSLLIEANTITDSQDISEHFNNFFTSIGQDLQKKYCSNQKALFRLSKGSQHRYISYFAHNTKEISDLIITLKNTKGLGPNSIPTDILKEIHETISIPFSTLINKSFTTGVFPNMSKIAKVVQIFKSETRMLCNNYSPISLLSDIGKINSSKTQFFLRNTQLLLSVPIWF